MELNAGLASNFELRKSVSLRCSQAYQTLVSEPEKHVRECACGIVRFDGSHTLSVIIQHGGLLFPAGCQRKCLKQYQYKYNVPQILENAKIVHSPSGDLPPILVKSSNSTHITDLQPENYPRAAPDAWYNIMYSARYTKHFNKHLLSHPCISKKSTPCSFSFTFSNPSTPNLMFRSPAHLSLSLSLSPPTSTPPLSSPHPLPLPSPPLRPCHRHRRTNIPSHIQHHLPRSRASGSDTPCASPPLADLF